MTKIFIDPGHGGSDPGAIGNGLQEKNLTLAISKKIRDLLLQYDNTQIKLSRESDQTLSLKERTDMANAWDADFLLSIHINAGGGTGFESFVYTNPQSASIAHQNAIHPEIMRQIDFMDRGKKRKNLHMVRESKMPGLLTESGFIDNTSDAAKLKLDAYLNKIALGHANGISKAFGLKRRVQVGDEVKMAETAEAKVMLNDSTSITAFIKDGRTYVQVREIADLLGLKIVYNNESKTTKLYEIK